MDGFFFEEHAVGCDMQGDAPVFDVFGVFQYFFMKEWFSPSDEPEWDVVFPCFVEDLVEGVIGHVSLWSCHNLSVAHVASEVAVVGEFDVHHVWHGVTQLVVVHGVVDVVERIVSFHSLLILSV